MTPFTDIIASVCCAAWLPSAVMVAVLGCDHGALNAAASVGHGGAGGAAISSSSASATSGAGGSKACAWDAPFGEPTLIAEFAGTMTDQDAARLTPDELHIVFAARVADKTNWQIYQAKRAHSGDPWGAAAPLGGVNDASQSYGASLASNELTVYFGSDRTGGAFHIYAAKRKSADVVFEPPAMLDGVNSTMGNSDYMPFVSADGSELWFNSSPPAATEGDDILRSRWTGSSWDVPVHVDVLNSSWQDWSPSVSADLLTVYFASDRPPSSGNDVWVAHRDGKASFGAPQRVPQLSSPASDVPSWLSPDGCRLYMSRTSSGSRHLYLATRAP